MKLPVFIIAGQSNAFGMSPVSGLKERAETKGVTVYQNSNVSVPFQKQFVPLQTGMGFGGDKIGLEYGVGEQLSQYYDEVLLIKYASDGTSLYDRWRSEGLIGEDYKGLLQTVRDAVRMCGREVELKALFWMQGENDASYQIQAEEYQKNLSAFVKNVGKDMGVDGLPVVIGQINPNNPVLTHVKMVNAAQKAVCAAQKNAIYVDTSNINGMADVYHYDAESERELGRRMARNFLEGKNMNKDCIIKSFEEGATTSGDILSGGKEKKNVRIGVLTCGYFEYWRMYPTLKAKVESDVKQVTDRITATYPDVVLSGMVDTLDTAREAGKLFREKNVDVVLMVYGTYTADFIALTALDYVKDRPLFVFSTQPHDNVDRKGDYEGSLRNSGLIGIAQITGTLRKMKRDYKIVVGSVTDDRAYGILDDYFRAAQAVEDIREANIGIIGHVFRGMYDLELSKTFFKNTFGVNVIMIQSSHLLDEWEKVTDQEVYAERDALLARFQRKNVTVDDVDRAIRLAIAMRKIAEKFHLDAMCFLDQHYVQKQVKTSARIGASLLMERTGMSVNCEGDLAGLVMMMLMRSLTGKAPLMGEWGEYDKETNSCLIIGHGIGTPDLAVDEKDVMLTRTPEEWGFDGAGLNYELIVKPGAATIGHIMEAPSGYRMIISPVESIPFPKLNFDELHALCKTQTPIREYLERVLDYGVSHHCILTPGNCARRLEIVAELLGIESFTIA